MKKKILTLICLIFCLCTAFSLGSACGDCEHVSVSDWIIDKQATCTETGARHKECTSCKKTLETETISMTGHDCVDDACKDCGKAIHLVFVENSDGESYSVAGLKENYETDIEVPSKYNGKPVTAIREDAFRDCRLLTSIVLPNSVTSIGYYAFRLCTSLTKVNYLGTIDGWISIDFYDFSSNPLTNGADLYINNEKVTEAVITTATEIKDYAFRDCTSLTSIEIPNSVESIGSSAFSGCTSLTSIVIPNSVTSIGYYAFRRCTSLTSIEIPNSVESIGSSAFSGCTSLESIEVDKNNLNYQSIEGNLYSKSGAILIQYAIGKASNSFTVPSSVESIGGDAFYDCSSLKEIVIPDSVTSIGSWAFEDCTSLTKVNYLGTIDGWVSIHFYYASSNPLANGADLYINNEKVTEAVITTATEIKKYAFSDCTSLTSVVIPNSVTSIGRYTFSNCTSLESITIGDSVESIGEYAFFGCTSLESITIGDSVESIGEYAFCGCTSLESITIGDSVTSIGSSAFADCDSLISIEIPDSVTSIGRYAFSFCFSLTKVNYLGTIDGWVSIDFYDFSSNPLSNGADLYINNEKVTEAVITTATEIKDYAFDGCTSLTSIEIPNSIISIGEYAFSYCTSLTSIEIPNSVTSIGHSAFYGCTALTIYCEAESKPSGWVYGWNNSNCPVVWGYDGE